MKHLMVAFAMAFTGCVADDPNTIQQFQTADVGVSDFADPAAENLTTYRVTELILRDPHLFRDPPFFDCRDVTYSAPAGFDSVNETIARTFVEDRNNDSLADFAVLFSLDDEEFAIGNAECQIGGRCDDEFADTTTPVRFQNEGICFEAASTFVDYEPRPRTIEGPCFSSDPAEMTFRLDRAKVILRDVIIAGQFTGVGVEGTMAGYLTLEEARLAEAKNGTLDEYLPGAGACMGGDGRDEGAGFTTGWWLFFDFDAKPIRFDEGGGCSTSRSATPGPEPLFLLALLWFGRRSRARRGETFPEYRSGS